MKRLLPVALLAILTGCQSDKPWHGRERGPQGTVAYEMTIETEDPGCKIEVNGDYKGESPVKVKVFGDKDGTFHNFNNGDFVIKAYPPKSGGMVQTKVYHTGAWFSPDDRIPERVYFNTSLDTVKSKERIDINVNKTEGK